MEANLPFELHSHGGGGFIVFEVGEAVALPMIALTKAILRGSAEAQEIVLDFEAHIVLIEGAGLADLFGHLIGGRMKAIRSGKHGACAVKKVHLSETV